ncbi:MAG TPA: EAL domain-containing protein [Gallionella sp.]|nr:EAL domain-containing protein [Gallionella sp.]
MKSSMLGWIMDKERMLNALINNLDGMLYCCLNDSQWTMVYLGQGCRELTGYEASDFLTDNTITWKAAIHPEYRKTVREIIDQAVISRQKFVIEDQFVQASGEIIWISERGCPLYDESGKVEAIEGFLQNITSQKQSQLAAYEAETRYRSIFENVAEGIYQTSLDGQYLNFNPALVKIYGYESADELRTAITDINRQLYVELGKRGEFVALMSSFGIVKNFEAQAYHKSGEIIWISENAREVRDQHGRLIFYEGTVKDITERKMYEKELEYQSTHDALTGLPNRTLMIDRLQQFMGIADRDNKKVAVVFLDLDQFKIINDSMGHHTGDELLKIMACRLLHCIRETDTVVRLGGDEFVLLITGQHKIEDISTCMRKVLSSVAEPCQINNQEFIVSCSIGISVYPDDAKDTTALLKYADSAMYKAKQTGRNTFQFYTAELNKRSMERLDLEYRLRLALENNEFLLHYQPKLDLSTGSIFGAEALLRWQPPSGEMISPASFIPVAEETGLIEDIGRWVLQEACHQAVALNKHFGNNFSIAVNVSPREFRQDSLVSSVLGVLQKSGLNPACLELEITENCLVHNPKSFIKILNELKSLGIRLAIDDFGTGYSSMAYLKDFPVDHLKIDQVFVSQLENESSNMAILKAIIALGHSLGMNVIAEGVETAFQRDFLRGVGCDKLQGYHISKPLPLHEFKKFMQEYSTSIGNIQYYAARTVPSRVA